MKQSHKGSNKPYRIYLDVTNFCSLNCRHCYAATGEARAEELTLNELKDVAQQIASLGIKNLIVSGGEPLSRSDIFDFLAYCSGKELNATLLTNGVFIDTAKSRLLSELNIDVRVSIDGVSKVSHDYIRGEGNFEVVLQALHILKAAKIKKLSVHFTVNRSNIGDILQIPFFLNEIGTRDIVISCIKPVGRALQHPELLIEPSLVLLVKERLNTIYRNKSINFHFYNDKNWDGLACPAAYAKCGITAEGRITPCVFLGSDFVGESIRKFSLEHLWSKDTMLAKLRNLPVNSSCSRCSQMISCNGGCRTRAIYFNGGLDAVDPYCCEMKKQKILMADFLNSHKEFAQIGVR